MQWTLLVILLISIGVGITHAAVVANNSRPKSCPRGQTLIRNQCVAMPSSTPLSTTPTPQQQQPTPSALQSGAPPGRTCPLGQNLRDNKCVAKQCPNGMAVNGEGKCDCAQGYHKVDNKCVSESLAQGCRGGQVSKRGNCIMPTAAPRPKVCPKDLKLNGQGKCVTMVQTQNIVCPSGQRKNRKGSCIPIVVGHSCGADKWINERGECGPTRPNNGCPVGKERNGLGNCIRIQTCSPGQEKDPRTGVCQQVQLSTCPPNQVMNGGRCVSDEINRIGRG